MTSLSLKTKTNLYIIYTVQLDAFPFEPKLIRRCNTCLCVGKRVNVKPTPLLMLAVRGPQRVSDEATKPNSMADPSNQARGCYYSRPPRASPLQAATFCLPSTHRTSPLPTSTVLGQQQNCGRYNYFARECRPLGSGTVDNTIISLETADLWVEKSHSFSSKPKTAMWLGHAVCCRSDGCVYPKQ